MKTITTFLCCLFTTLSIQAQFPNHVQLLDVALNNSKTLSGHARLVLLAQVRVPFYIVLRIRRMPTTKSNEVRRGRDLRRLVIRFSLPSVSSYKMPQEHRIISQGIPPKTNKQRPGVCAQTRRDVFGPVGKPRTTRSSLAWTQKRTHKYIGEVKF